MTGNIAILQELVKGSANGSLDADLLRTNDAHFSVNADKQLEFHPDAVVTNQVTNDAIPATGGSTSLAPSVNATRRAITQLGTQGRLLPEANGAAHTVLLGDKTFGTVPKRFRRTELAFGDITTSSNWIGYPSTDLQIGQRVMFPNVDYDMRVWDDIEIYVSSIANTPQRIFLVQRIASDLIPSAVHTNGPTWQWSFNTFRNDDWVYEEGDAAERCLIKFAHSGGKLVMMQVQIQESGTSLASQNTAPRRSLHCGIYGINY